MRNKWTISAWIVMAVLAFAAVAYSQVLHRRSDNIWLGTTDVGTPIDLIAVGQITVASGGTTGTATITGLSTSDIAIVSSNEAFTSATLLVSGACTANTLTVTIDQNNGADLVVNYVAFGIY